MSKDEYLITDAPLKALTVFAMPMILGSFFQQVYNMADSIIVGQFVCESLFWSQRLQQNENNRVNITDQFPDSKYTSGCLWLLLFPFDDEVITDTC